jgi:hypothetical protein
MWEKYPKCTTQQHELGMGPISYKHEYGMEQACGMIRHLGDVDSMNLAWVQFPTRA